MSETDLERLRKWDRKALTTSPDGWSIGVAQNILAIEARLAKLEESSHAVQAAPETAAEVANDPARESKPSLTDEQREAIFFCLSCAQDYRDGLERCDNPSQEQCERAARMIAIAKRLAVDSKPQTLPPRETWPHNIRPRGEMDHLINHEPFPTLDRDPPRNEAIACPSLVAAVRRLLDSVNRRHPDKDPRQWTCPHMQALDDMTQPFASVVAEQATDDGPGDGYRWVNTGEALEADDELLRRGNGWGATLLAGIGCGQPNTYRRRITPDAAVDPIVAAGARLRKSFPDDAGRRLVDGVPMTPAEMMHALTVAREEIARLTAERDSERNRVGSLRSNVARLESLNASLTAQRDAALREVERHKMTEQEREAFESASWPSANGFPPILE